ADPSGGGVGAAGGGRGGSGLAGLRERLAEVDGTPEAGFAGSGTFRVVAEVPLRETAPAREVTA
ncbi:sensor histidine kinase, partial [Streptomyces sp. NPDC059894]